VIGAGRQGA